MKKIVDYLFMLTSSILILIGISGILWYITLRITHAPYQTLDLMLIIIATIDIFALSIFFIPLISIRSMIKDKKIEEKQVIFSIIKEIEKSLTYNPHLDNQIYGTLERMYYASSMVEKIDSINEWVIGSRKKIDLGFRVILTFIPIILEILFDI